MATAIRSLSATALLIALGAMLACGGDSKDEETDPFARTFREGIYKRFDDGKNYEIRFGVSVGRYVLLVDGVEQRRGTHTLVSTAEGDPALGLIDEGEFPAKCPEDQLLGAYTWKFKDNTLTLDAFEEKCDQRKKELESDKWLYEGPAPTETPAPAPTATP